MTVLNAFQSVRPRGVDMPSAVPVVAKAGQVPAKLPGSLPRVLDRKGCLNAPLAPRVYGSISVEGRDAGQASADKRSALLKGGL
ncbi:hypothetical protein KW843_07595 [Acidovorax sp. sif1233]|uniref:hypothetical protein n=1 Tax=Acidovorax sp. sif1233 TaxID=2854792 RepID=UPI001C4668CB|nr:hypothetical protein [Acidovorax sp. sif1233]MBV7454330.1 hypothetical protein [Acidovorax sp. sif1233]